MKPSASKLQSKPRRAAMSALHERVLFQNLMQGLNHERGQSLNESVNLAWLQQHLPTDRNNDTVLSEVDSVKKKKTSPLLFLHRSATLSHHLIPSMCHLLEIWKCHQLSKGKKPVTKHGSSLFLLQHTVTLDVCLLWLLSIENHFFRLKKKNSNKASHIRLDFTRFICLPYSIQAAVSVRIQPPCASQSWWWTRRLL